MEMQELIERGQDLAVQFAPKIVAAIAVFVLGRWVAKFLARQIGRAHV